MLIYKQRSIVGEATDMDDLEALQMIASRCEGWQKAFTVLYKRYEDALIAYYCRTRDKEAASDMAQSLWLTLLERAEELSHLERSDGMKGILMHIARCQVIDLYRKEKLHKKYGLVSLDEQEKFKTVAYNVKDKSADASGGIASREIESIVSKVLKRYRKREQIVFRKMEEGCPAREVGRMVGYTEATVYKKYSLMRRNIRLALIQGGYILLALLMFTE